MAHRRHEVDGFFEAPPPLTLSFDGSTYSARPGETVAQTLLAHGVYTLGRSGKYHRPRGLFCGRLSCGNCVARVDGLPNKRLCAVQANAVRTVQSQNTLGTARFDALESVDWVFSAGLDHHHLMTGVPILNRMAVAFARELAGLGRLPDAGAGPQAGLPPESLHVQVAIVGGGDAGRAVAAQTRRAGLETLVLEALPGREQAEAVTDAQVIGMYDDRELLAIRNGHQLRVRANIIVLATGAYAQLPPCPGNDAPGVIALRAVEEALARGIVPGHRVALAVAPDAMATWSRRAQSLMQALVQVGVDVLPLITQPLSAIAGRAPQLEVSFDDQTVSCDALVWASRPTPAYELARQMGLDTPLDLGRGGFVPLIDPTGETTRDGVFVAGELAGVGPDAAAEHGRHVGQAITRKLRWVATEELA